MYHRKMEKQMNNVKSVRTLMLPELSDANKRSLLLPQVQANHQANNRSTLRTMCGSTTGGWSLPCVISD
jgi:hypothetical protein